MKFSKIEKYKICPWEYTTSDYGLEINKAVNARLSKVKLYTTGYNPIENRHIPQLTQELFKWKIFYGKNAYWVSQIHRSKKENIIF